ncbi:MAG: ABC transporter ATP-binding protein [Vicinamibacterales bacterium]
MTALEVTDLRHRFGDRESLSGVGFSVGAGDIFALLGPNGGGKTTLFRIISTLLRPTSGTVEVFGLDLVRRPSDVRRKLGVVFQSPAVDPWLTVLENLRHHGYLYGLSKPVLDRGIEHALERFGLTPRASDRVSTLSGGLRRRVELAKALLPKPQLLVLDEPSSGLDPGARRDLLHELKRLRDDAGTTVVLTTHIVDEAAVADRVGILHEGRLAAIGTPTDLTDALEGDILTIDPIGDPSLLKSKLHDHFGIKAQVVGRQIRIERRRAHEFVPTLIESLPGEIATVSVGRPTLDDVFTHHTGTKLPP